MKSDSFIRLVLMEGLPHTRPALDTGDGAEQTPPAVRSSQMRCVAAQTSNNPVHKWRNYSSVNSLKDMFVWLQGPRWGHLPGQGAVSGGKVAKEGTRAAIAGVSSEVSTKQVVGPGQDGGVPGRGNVTSMTFGAMVGKRSESTVGASGAVSRWWGPWVPPPVCTQLVISSSLVALNTDYALMAFECLSPGWAFPRASDNGMQLLFRDPIGVSAFT